MKTKTESKKDGKVLNFTDRIIIGSILPTEGNKVTLLLNRELRKKLEITNKEKLDAKMIQSGVNVQWDSTKDKGVLIPLTEIEIAVISETFKKLDTAEKLTENMLETMAKFE